MPSSPAPLIRIASGLRFRHEAGLILLLAIELIVFGCFGRRFLTADNGVNIIRHSVEIGMLALVMLPVILTGGIDLSVGSLLGLCAVLFGKLWRDVGVDWPMAAVGSVVVGLIGGAMNAFLIARLRLPPLIVTLSTYSLFRGLAEAITQGTDAFTGFPESFLFVGTGAWGGLPAQAGLLLACAVGIAMLIHQTTWGRSIRAIGFSAEGAEYAGLPVRRRVASAYCLAGAIAGLAALTYTARFGTAKADAGTGYELAAITAVVLGGASIFGGRGTVAGTVLGVAVLGVLGNGLTRLPATLSTASELTGILTGLLLLASLALPRLAAMACSLRTVRTATHERPKST